MFHVQKPIQKIVQVAIKESPAVIDELPGEFKNGDDSEFGSSEGYALMIDTRGENPVWTARNNETRKLSTSDDIDLGQFHLQKLEFSVQTPVKEQK